MIGECSNHSATQASVFYGTMILNQRDLIYHEMYTAINHDKYFPAHFKENIDNQITRKSDENCVSK